MVHRAVEFIPRRLEREQRRYTCIRRYRMLRFVDHQDDDLA